MTLKEFREQTKDLPDDMEIILQKDAEGNGYSPCSGADPNSIYVANCTWSGEVYSLDWSAEDTCMGEDQWEEMKTNNKPCLVMYPVN